MPIKLIQCVQAQKKSYSKCSAAGFYMFEMDPHKQDHVNLLSITSVLMTLSDIQILNVGFININITSIIKGKLILR